MVQLLRHRSYCRYKHPSKWRPLSAHQISTLYLHKWLDYKRFCFCNIWLLRRNFASSFQNRHKHGSEGRWLRRSTSISTPKFLQFISISGQIISISSFVLYMVATGNILFPVCKINLAQNNKFFNSQSFIIISLSLLSQSYERLSKMQCGDGRHLEL